MKITQKTKHPMDIATNDLSLGMSFVDENTVYTVVDIPDCNTLSTFQWETGIIQKHHRDGHKVRVVDIDEVIVSTVFE